MPDAAGRPCVFGTTPAPTPSGTASACGEMLVISVTIRQLQVFLAIAKTENIGTASEHLVMSKSAVSQALAELEGRLGVQLFDRTRGRIHLTPEGRRLMPQADEMVNRAVGISELFKVQKTFSAFRVGCTRTIGTFMLADLLRGYEDEKGWVPTATIANIQQIVEKLGRFELDTALIEGPVTDPDFVTEPWMEDEMIVIAPKEHPLTGRLVQYEELANAQWILREEGSASRNFFDTQLRQKISLVNVRVELNSFDAILRSVIQGLGITYMSARVLTDPFYGRYFSRVELPDVFVRQLTFCHQRDKYLSNDIRDWMSLCRRYAMRQNQLMKDRAKLRGYGFASEG